MLDLIARYTFLTGCKDNGLLDLGIYDKILYQLDEVDMERTKYYMERLKEHHDETREILDRVENIQDR